MGATYLFIYIYKQYSQSPDKDPEHKDLSELLWLARLGMCHQIILPGKLGAICATPLGEDYWKLIPGFSGISP